MNSIGTRIAMSNVAVVWKEGVGPGKRSRGDQSGRIGQ